MSNFAVIAILLTITGFYAFLSIYILVHFLSHYMVTSKAPDDGEDVSQGHRGLPRS